MADSDILEKIRKVAGYTKSSNANEAAVAAAKLSELLLKHNLDMSQIPADEQKPDPFEKNEWDTGKSNIVNWEADLAGAVARANLCKVVINSRNNYIWLGRSSNIEVGQFVFETVRNDLLRLATDIWAAILNGRKFPKHPVFAQIFENAPDLLTVNGKAWKNSFYYGAVSEIKKRLNEQRDQMSADTNMNALITTSGRELAAYVRSQYPRLGSRSGGYVSQNSGYTAGQQAGRSMQFKTGVGAGGANATRRLGSGR